ncbi:MAG: type I methionyl aminopeptidase [bacterium]|nr:type I methionyl aminopeptidase [bacterium]
MIVRTGEEARTLRECGKRLAGIVTELVAAVRPGLTTIELDELAERLILEAGGQPVFKGYRSQKNEPPFPASLCVSINEEVVHGIPRRERTLAAGDIVGLDIGMRWPARDGLITDMAVTVPVGAVTPLASRLLDATRAALGRGIGILEPGMPLGDLGAAIQEAIESEEFSVVRDLVGHGVGRQLHEEPYVPNYGVAGEGEIVREGMVLAIEPMATVGGPSVRLADDGWTWRTADGSLAAHFEHTVLVTKEGAEVLTKL